MSPKLQALGIDKLSPDERVALAHEILDSVTAEAESAPLTEAQKREIDRRLEEHRKNPDAAVPWEEVEAAALARFGQK
jgi:putative addiction module component (TIGR02574 family)